MLKISSLKSLEEFKKLSNFLPVDEVKGYKMYGVDDVLGGETFCMKCAPWINGEEKCYVLKKNDVIYPFKAKNSSTVGDGYYVPYDTREEIYKHYAYDEVDSQYFKACIESLGHHLVDGSLKEYDIRFSMQHHTEIQFHFGETWPSFLRGCAAFHIRKDNFIWSILYADGDELGIKFTPGSLEFIGYVGVHTIDCFHFDGGTVNAYNSYTSITGKDAMNRLATYMQKMKKAAELMADVGQLVKDGVELTTDTTTEY